MRSYFQEFAALPPYTIYTGLGDIGWRAMLSYMYHVYSTHMEASSYLVYLMTNFSSVNVTQEPSYAACIILLATQV